MAEITIESLNDLIESSNPDFGGRTVTYLAHDFQEFIAMPKIFRSAKAKEQSGKHIEFRAVTGHNNSFHMTTLYAVDEPATTDVLTSGSVEWRHWSFDYSYDLREIDINLPPAQIIDLMQTKRNSAWSSAAEGMETQFFGPAPGVDDNTNIWNLRYWLKGSTTKGFNNTATGSHTTVGGINPTTYPRWGPWNNTYAADKTDPGPTGMVEVLKESFYKTGFKNPVPVAESKKGTDMKECLCTWDTVTNLERVAKAQNENLGPKLDPFRNKVTIQGIPFTPVPYWDDDALLGSVSGAADVVACINWAWFYPVFKSGWNFKENKPKQAGDQHTVSTVFVDGTGNVVCKNRRAHTILVKTGWSGTWT